MEDLPVECKPATASGAKDHREHHALPGARSIRRFGNRQAIRVVRAAHFPVERRTEITIEGSSIDPSRICIFYSVGNLRNRPGNTDANRPAASERYFDFLDSIFNRANGPVIVVAWRGYPVSVHFVPVALQCDKLDLRPA